MKKKSIIIVFILILIAAFVVVYRHRSRYSTPHAPCIEADIKAYKDAYNELSKRRDKKIGFLENEKPLFRPSYWDRFWGGPQLLDQGTMDVHRELTDFLKDKDNEPETIYNGHICGYLTSPSDPPQCLDPGDAGFPGKSQAILNTASAVGRLEIINGSDHDIWGTAVLVGDNLIATSCHVIDSISFTPIGSTVPVLVLDDQQRLVVDFSETNEHIDANEFPVQSVVKCSQQTGLDVALLSISATCVKKTGCSKLPDHIVLSSTNPKAPDAMAIVGDPDLLHPVNPDADNIYSAYKQMKFAKFVLHDNLAGVTRCENDVKILLSLATTNVGESGSVVIDVQDNRSDVVGFHTCCTLYEDEVNWPPPRSDMACAELKRTIDSQSVSSCSVLEDKDLCDALGKANGLQTGFKCGQSKCRN